MSAMPSTPLQLALGIVVADQRRRFLVVLLQALFEHRRIVVLAHRQARRLGLFGALADSTNQRLVVDDKFDDGVES